MKEKDNTKRNIIIGLVLLVISILIIVVINLKNKTLYIVVNDKVLQYQDNTWENVNNTSQIFGKYKFNVYINNESKGKYQINYVNDIWYFFDNNNDSHRFDGNLFAYHGDLKLNLKDLNIENIDYEDIDKINDALINKNTYVELSDLSFNQKIIKDFDNDGNNEKLYSLSNIDSENEANDYYSTLIYINEDKNDIVEFRKETYENKENLFLYDINYLININNKKDDMLIVTAGQNLDPTSNYNMVYSINNKELKKEHDYSSNLIDVKLNEKDYFGRNVLIIIGVILLIGIIGYLFFKKRKKDRNEI